MPLRTVSFLLATLSFGGLRLMAESGPLITVFDMKLNEHLRELEEADLLENTVVFVFSDHGFGLPRCKSWT